MTKRLGNGERDGGYNLTTERECALVKGELTKPQRNFIEYCKKFGWGKLEVTVKDGEPVMVSPLKQDIKLD